MTTSASDVISKIIHGNVTNSPPPLSRLGTGPTRERAVAWLTTRYETYSIYRAYTTVSSYYIFIPMLNDI